jgi:geranylgeranyl diphosphate/geranylgeranyl-bacteriochlorophyllide a reductase
MGQRIAILGTGPTSLYAALLLAVKGHQVTVYDPKTAWEKPCGGALSGPVLSEMPLFEDFSRFVPIEGLRLLSPKNREIRIPFETPLPVALRDDLTDFLRARCEASGVVFSPLKLEGFAVSASGWNLSLRGGQDRADFLVIGDGAGGIARKTLGLNGASPEMTLEVGYDIPAPFEKGIGVIKFLPEMNGCFSALPNGTGTAVRLWSTGRQLHARALIDKLDGIVQRLLDVPLHGDMGRSVAHIPAMGKIERRNLMGEKWVAIGDAGGFIHPLSKDGLYFGLKSAATLAISMNGSLDGRSYWMRLKAQVLKPLRKRTSRQRWWRNQHVVDWILRRTQVSEKSRRFLSELVGAKPI